MGLLADLRRANRHEALTILRLNGPLTQAEISRATGLSHASVSNIVRELTSQGLARTSEVLRNGRRVSEVTLEPSTGLVAGIDFGNHHMRAAVADFTHTVRGETYLTLPYGHEAASSVAEAATDLQGAGQRRRRPDRPTCRCWRWDCRDRPTAMPAAPSPRRSCPVGQAST